VTIPVGGFQLQVFTTCLEGRFNGPALGILRHTLLRPHGDLGGKAVLVTMGPGAIMHVHPSHRHSVLPEAVPVARARDDRKVAGPSSIPGHGAAGARGRVRHDCVGGRELLACPTWTSHGARPARGRRFV